MSRTTRRNAPAPIEGRGPWLIRSHYWGMWHCRNSTGGAAGYTNDIGKAGLFDFSKAREYHEPGGRDEAVPIGRHLKSMRARLAEMTAERDAFAAHIDEVGRVLNAANPKAPAHD